MCVRAYKHVNACLNHRTRNEFYGQRAYASPPSRRAQRCLMCVLSLEGILRVRCRSLAFAHFHSLCPARPVFIFLSFLIYFIDVIYGFFKHNFAEPSLVGYSGMVQMPREWEKAACIQIHSYEPVPGTRSGEDAQHLFATAMNDVCGKPGTG